jgi:uncharacterized membrane protein
MDEQPIDAWQAFATAEPGDHSPARHPRFLLIAAATLVGITILGLIVLRPTGEAEAGFREELNTLGVPSQFHAAEVVEVIEAPCAFGDTICRTVLFELVAGPDVGVRYLQDFPVGGTTPSFGVGDTAILSYRPPEGVVVDNVEAPCEGDASVQCRELRIAVEGRSTETIIVPDDADAAFLLSGDPIDVTYVDTGSDILLVDVQRPTVQSQYQFADFQRRGVLTWVALLFAAAVVILGRWRGVLAIVGLTASLGVLLLFVLPAILDGRSPVWVALFGSLAIAILTLYVAHGFGPKTTVALMGMGGALLLTAILSSIVLGIADITGFASEESSLLTIFDGIDVRGLVLAGIVLGAAGALDDVTITQASAVWELHSVDERLGAMELTRRGLRIGRDHIASTVNTLLLAYAGAALPLLVLFVVSSQSLGAIANSEVVAIEIIRTLVGSIGLVAAVPFTTWLAAQVVTRMPNR